MTIIADKFDVNTTSDGAAGIFRPTLEKIPGVPIHTSRYTPCTNSRGFSKFNSLEFLGNLLTQTNQTKEKFIRLYYLDRWIQKVQFDEQNKSLTKCTMSK